MDQPELPMGEDERIKSGAGNGRQFFPKERRVSLKQAVRDRWIPLSK
jgi:hypothetical protein